jgi:capping protein alpha
VKLMPIIILTQKNKQVVAVDHVNLQILPDEPVPIFDGALDDSIENYRFALQQILEEYMTKFYSNDYTSAVYAKNGVITILIIGQHSNLKNYYAGQWSSKWQIAFHGGSADFSGKIQIHAHYFEEGNVQLQTSKDIERQTIKKSDPSHFSETILQSIQNSENELQKGLEEMYTSMKDETLKSMRRVMTVTRTKFNWNVSEHRLAKHMRK